MRIRIWMVCSMIVKDMPFEVLKVNQSTDKTPSTCIRWKNGVELELLGATIEDCISIDNRTIVFLTEDFPFEEALHIALVSADGILLDHVEVSSPYATGSYKKFKDFDGEGMTFSFFENVYTRLSLSEKPILNVFNRERFVRRNARLFQKGFLKLKHENLG